MLKYLFLVFVLYLSIVPVAHASLTSENITRLAHHIEDHPNDGAVLQHMLLHRLLTSDSPNSIIERLQHRYVKQLLFELYPPRGSASKDDQLTYYVGPTHSYTNKLYKPHDLVTLTTNSYLHFATTLSTHNRQLRPLARDALDQLARDYYARFHEPLVLNSARRPYYEQQNAFHPSCIRAGICAHPGTSEHQNGYTIDIANMHGKKHQRMRQHAHQYGFHQSYQQGKYRDGIAVEPWHRRYLGPGLATYLHEHDLSFVQWYKQEY